MMNGLPLVQGEEKVQMHNTSEQAEVINITEDETSDTEDHEVDEGRIKYTEHAQQSLDEGTQAIRRSARERHSLLN